MKNFFCIYSIVLLLINLPIVALCAEKTGMDAVKLMEEGKVDKAIQIFEGLASKGDTRAMIQLGIYYHQGTEVKQDYTKAMDWYLKALEKNNADAFVNIGVMHRDGQAVPKNKKIAYCVFLTTHMCGMGTQNTQIRSNSCLRRIMSELSKDDIKDCLSNYTLGYIKAYIEAKGKMKGIPDKYKPSKKNPALKDLGWFLDSEIDAIYGPPTEEEKKARQQKAEKRKNKMDALQHTLVFQIRFPKDTAKQYRSYEVITDDGMGGGPIAEKKLKKDGKFQIYEESSIIWADRHRYITIESKDGKTLVYPIDLPVKPSLRDWSKWQVPSYLLKNSMDTFSLIHGKEPGSKTTELSDNPPVLHFKVIKK